MKHYWVHLYGCADTCFHCGVSREGAKADYCRHSDIDAYKARFDTENKTISPAAAVKILQESEMAGERYREACIERDAAIQENEVLILYVAGEGTPEQRDRILRECLKRVKERWEGR